ncbi:MAG TPA: hypothetical protein VGE83_06795 [Terracidiphilus sp.]|jgi:hypothetical protein
MTLTPTLDPSNLAAWQTLLAAIVGGVLTFGGAFAAKFWEHRQQRLALRAAFGAEIDALLKISEIRKHEALAENLLGSWKRGEDVVPTMFGSPPQSDPVFANNVDKIGLLGSDASEVVLFYTKLAAVRVHLRLMCEGGLRSMTLPQRIDFVEQAFSIWREAKPSAEELVARLTRKASGRGKPRTVSR